MNLEQAIAQLTEAVNQNTAALKEILSVGATTAAETLVAPTPKKRAAKAAPLAVVEPEPENLEPEYRGAIYDEPVMPTAESEPEDDATEEVPDLPVAELRNALKELIKGKLLADTEGQVKGTFEALRQKYGVTVIKELADDQVSSFYKEVLSW